jgi:hypothetical protein
MSHFECVADTLTVKVLREEFGKEAMEALSEEHKGKALGIPFAGHVILLIAEDCQGYPCPYPWTEKWVLI